MLRKTFDEKSSNEYKKFEFLSPNEKRNVDEYDYLLKFLVIGDSGVGKSCLLLRFCEDAYTESYISTIGINFRKRKIDYQDRILSLQLFDSAGQERFHFIQANHYRGVHGILLVYDITDKASFDNIKTWSKEVERYASNNVSCILVGAKSDLGSAQREVNDEDGVALAKELGIPFVTVSSKMGENVDEAFFILASEVLKKILPNQEKKDAEYLQKKIENRVMQAGLSAKAKTLPEMVDGLFEDRQRRQKNNDKKLGDFYQDFDKEVLSLAKLGLLSDKNMRHFIPHLYQPQCHLKIESQKKILTSPNASQKEKNIAIKELYRIKTEIELLKQKVEEKSSNVSYSFIKPKNESLITLDKILNTIHLVLPDIKREKKDEKPFQPIEIKQQPALSPKEFKKICGEVDACIKIVDDKEVKEMELLTNMLKLESFKTTLAQWSSQNEKTIASNYEIRIANAITKANRILSKLPPEFCCPLSGKEMKNPVITPSGHTFDQSSLVDFLKNGGNQERLRQQLNDSSIICRENDILFLIKNYVLRNFMDEYQQTKKFNREYFHDPIHLDSMEDPVVISSGHTMDKTSALDLKTGVCPLTNKKLNVNENGTPKIIPNLIFIEIIQKYSSLAGEEIIQLSSKDITQIILQDDLQQLQDYVGDDHEKFIKMMALKSSVPTFIQIAAQNGKREFVNFFIENAMKSPEGKKFLKEQLLQVDESGRGAIHIVAMVNKDEVAPCLAALLAVAKELGIFNDLINKKDNTVFAFGSTPLMLAASMGALQNVITLVEHKAALDAKSTQGDRTAYDIALRKDPKNSIPILKYFITHEPYSSVFKRKFGDVEKIIKDTKANDIDKIKTQLLEIEIDSATLKPPYQLSALKKLIEYTLSANDPDESLLFLATCKYVNFSTALQDYKADSKSEVIDSVFAKLKEIQKEHTLSDKDCESLARGYLFSQFNTLAAQKLALEEFFHLKEASPQVVIKALKWVNNEMLQSYSDHFRLMKRMLLEHGKQLQMELGPINKSNNKLFDKGKNETLQILNKVMDDIGSATDKESIKLAVLTLPSDNDALRFFKELAWENIKNFKGQTNTLKY